MCFWLVSCLLYAMQQCIAPCKWIAIAVNTFQFCLEYMAVMSMCIFISNCIVVSLFSSYTVVQRTLSVTLAMLVAVNTQAIYVWPFDCAVIYHKNECRKVEKFTSEPRKYIQIQNDKKNTRNEYGNSATGSNLFWEIFFYCFPFPLVDVNWVCDGISLL